jgi:hypothetical protein
MQIRCLSWNLLVIFMGNLVAIRAFEPWDHSAMVTVGIRTAAKTGKLWPIAWASGGKAGLANAFVPVTPSDLRLVPQSSGARCWGE